MVVHAPALMAGVLPLLAQLQAWLLGRQSGCMSGSHCGKPSAPKYCMHAC